MSKKRPKLSVRCVNRYRKKRAYSNLSLHHVIETNELSAQDVALLTEIVYGTIQRRDTLDYYLQPFVKGKIEPWVRLLLRMSLYQMVFLDRIPDRAVLFEAVEIAKRRGHRGIASLVNGVLRSIQRQGLRSFDEIKDDIERLAVATSHPLWLVRRWVAQFGLEETKRMCEANNLPPEQTARVNAMRVTVEEAIARLKEEGIEAVPSSVVPVGIKMVKGNAAKTSVFQEGLVTIQDESSMLVAYALSPTDTDVVLDCCAAPGGKTTHMAERMNNKGRVVALDIHDHKVKLIEQQAKRLGLSNIEAKQLDSRQAHTQFAAETFDRILVDAPCSGLGVIRRKPEIKYAKTKTISHNLPIFNEIFCGRSPRL